MWKIEGEVLVNVYTFCVSLFAPFFCASLLRGAAEGCGDGSAR